jgi:pyruvate formate lyase activating enzyme
MENGLRYVYTGNVIDPKSTATRCPGCGKTVVERDGYRLGRWRLAVSGGQACCEYCGQPVAGVFSGRPGGWGAHRRPVYMEN